MQIRYIYKPLGLEIIISSIIVGKNIKEVSQYYIKIYLELNGEHRCYRSSSDRTDPRTAYFFIESNRGCPRLTANLQFKLNLNNPINNSFLIKLLNIY